MHVAPAACFIPSAGMVEVALVEADEGIEIRLRVGGSVVTTSVTLYPELAVELGTALVEHAERAPAIERSALIGGGPTHE